MKRHRRVKGHRQAGKKKNMSRKAMKKKRLRGRRSVTMATTKTEREMMSDTKKLRYVLHTPNSGEPPAYLGDDPEGVAEYVKQHVLADIDGFLTQDGDSVEFAIKAKVMTDDEVDALPVV